MSQAAIERATTADRHDEKAVAFFGTWTLVGLFLDGWAHQQNKPETFFSPWHGVLYSGFTAAVLYFMFRERVLKRRSTVADPLAGIGLGIFVVGAVGDFVWHEIFGIEVDLEALLSPTHLLLLTGGLLMLSMGARVAAARDEGRTIPFTRFFPTLVSLTLTAALVAFFTQYFAAFEFGGLFRAPNGADVWEVHGVGSVFVTNAILMGTTLFALRRWDTPFGTFTVLFGAIAFGIVGMDEFRLATHIVAAAAAGLVADLLATRLRPSPQRRRQAYAFAVLVPIVLWGLWLVSIQLNDGVHWAVELWTGTVFLTALEGAGLAALVFPRTEQTMRLESATAALASGLGGGDPVTGR